MKLEVSVKREEGLISWNFEELKKSLDTQLEKFRGVVVTEETITEHKDVRAKLNKIKTIIDNERKKVKKEYSSPLLKFEDEVKSLTGMIDEANKLIDSQIKAIEEQEKLAKRGQIEKFIEAYQLDTGLPFTIRIPFNDKWLNKSYSFKQIKEEIEERIQEVKNGYKFVQGWDGEYKDVLLTAFVSHQDMNYAMSRLEEHKQAKAAIGTETYVEKEDVDIEPEIADNKEIEVLHVMLELEGTKEQFTKLQTYLNDFENMLDWKVVKKGEK